MRKKIVAGNWKMNTVLPEGEFLVKQLEFLTKEMETDVEIIVCPPFTHLATIGKLIKDNGIKICMGAQNCADHESGAYTGEVSVKMLKDVSCKYVILGHSERREYYGETSEKLYKKINLVINEGMVPIFCVGERLEERESGRHFEVVSEQIQEVLYKLRGVELDKVVVAYEPVWAIGTGRTATSDQAEEMHAYIRRVIASKFGEHADIIPILYGGSCKPSNAAEIFLKQNVDGGLIGGASLVAQDFIDIVKSF
ncbi:MAG: triose-phosphate isomerase [Bacteroidetes bacterium GWF2_40_14]|nr:MAG: triose-phosphate isomerase [Bacteroidetes bacterium GWF2_40_14]